jgi:hypothetical protein
MFRRILLIFLALLLLGGASLLIPDVRQGARSVAKAVLRPEPPAPITPIALSLPAAQAPAPSATPTAPPSTSTTPPTALPTAASTEVPPTLAPSATALPTSTSLPTPTPLPPTPTPGPVEVNGRLYDAYIPAANKEGQAYQYSCEFDAAWVIFQTYGLDVSVDELIGAMALDTSIEPYIEETAQGFIIHGGNINQAFSGDYTANFLARSTGRAIAPVFEQYGMYPVAVRDRPALEAALRDGALVWMKTTVDFKPWRPATWRMPDGSTYQTVLGNDHAVVVMGFNADTVVIRDVLGPTSSNWQRPYEYEVGWPAFMAAWGAQSFDALAVYPPGSPPPAQ